MFAFARPSSLYLGSIDALLVRRDTLETAIDELVPGSPWAETIGRLRCLRGIDTMSAVGLCAEIGGWARFPKAAHVMSYLGLVPSEDSTGSSRRQGSITKTGSGHGRRLLVEAAWHYRRAPAKGQALKISSTPKLSPLRGESHRSLPASRRPSHPRG